MKNKTFALLLGVFFSIVTLVGASAKDYVFTSDGIGPLKCGAAIQSIPKIIPGIYDQITIERKQIISMDEDYIEFYAASLNGERVLEIYNDAEYNPDRIVLITILSPRLKTKSGFSLSTKAKDLIKAKGVVICMPDFSAAIFCDGVLFYDLPLSKAGKNKKDHTLNFNYGLYDASDLLKDGCAAEIRINSDNAQIAQRAQKQAPGATTVSIPQQAQSDEAIPTNQLYLLIAFLAVYFAILGHMVYANYFRKGYPETLPEVSGSVDNNAYVKAAMDNLYNVEFTPYCDPNETPGPDVFNFPIGRKSAYHAKEVLDEVYANHLPVDGEAAEDLRKVSIITNEAFKRTFAGSWKYLIITAIIGVCSCLLNSDLTPLPFFSLSCVLYYFSCRTPNYVLMKKDLKALKSGRVSNSLTNGLIAGIFGLAASAPVYVTITKSRRTGEVLKREEDHSMTVVGLVIMIMLFIILAMFMMFIGIFNYLRNYVLRK